MRAASLRCLIALYREYLRVGTVPGSGIGNWWRGGNNAGLAATNLGPAAAQWRAQAVSVFIASALKPRHNLGNNRQTAMRPRQRTATCRLRPEEAPASGAEALSLPVDGALGYDRGGK